MTKPSLIENSVRTGVWHGLVAAPGSGGVPPRLEVSLDGAVLGIPDLRPAHGMADHWSAQFSIPPEVLSDGLQIFLVQTTGTPGIIGHFSVVTGSAVRRDLMAEVELLRAELDMLKQAFRRHCAETGG